MQTPSWKNLRVILPSQFYGFVTDCACMIIQHLSQPRQTRSTNSFHCLYSTEKALVSTAYSNSFSFKILHCFIYGKNNPHTDGNDLYDHSWSKFLGTKIVGYNRMRFLLESLEDLNSSFAEKYGGGLQLFTGKPVDIFTALLKRYKIEKICFEQVRTFITLW